ncbi:hypothetical protein BRC85_07850 [Halobacteriales archaeon QS_1_69_70]|nr:MAG: hypothetical protein BRC85_07850 [Halobacteriales archaeon QS_1_69_70]
MGERAPEGNAGDGPGSDDGAEPADGADGTADPFADLDAADVDGEVWAELDEGADVDGDLFERLAEESPTRTVDLEVDADAETTVVPKSKYCQRCEYFTEPPDVSCSHAGTTIAEVVDTDSFRVQNCPVVADRHGASSILEGESPDRTL